MSFDLILKATPIGAREQGVWDVGISAGRIVAIEHELDADALRLQQRDGGRGGGRRRRTKRSFTEADVYARASRTLINNAGVFLSKPCIEYQEAELVLLSGMNLAGAFRLSQRAAAVMLRRRTGHIAFIAASLVDQSTMAMPLALLDHLGIRQTHVIGACRTRVWQ